MLQSYVERVGGDKERQSHGGYVIVRRLDSACKGVKTDRDQHEAVPDCNRFDRPAILAMGKSMVGIVETKSSAVHIMVVVIRRG